MTNQTNSNPVYQAIRDFFGENFNFGSFRPLVESCGEAKVLGLISVSGKIFYSSDLGSHPSPKSITWARCEGGEIVVSGVDKATFAWANG